MSSSPRVSRVVVIVVVVVRKSKPRTIIIIILEPSSSSSSSSSNHRQMIVEARARAHLGTWSRNVDQIVAHVTAAAMPLTYVAPAWLRYDERIIRKGTSSRAREPSAREQASTREHESTRARERKSKERTESTESTKTQKAQSTHAPRKSREGRISRWGLAGLGPADADRLARWTLDFCGFICLLRRFGSCTAGDLGLTGSEHHGAAGFVTGGDLVERGKEERCVFCALLCAKKSAQPEPQKVGCLWLWLITPKTSGSENDILVLPRYAF